MALSLSNLVRKDKPKPPIMVIYGPGGMGKTTLAAEFPSPIFIQTEAGEGSNDIVSFTRDAIGSYQEVIEALTALATEDHDFKTVVLDSITRLEPLIWAALCAEKSWGSIEEPGYGKGYIEADTYWRDVLKALSYLRDDKGMTVIMIAHETVTTFRDPLTDSYDRYTMRLHKRAEAMVREVCDALGFMNQITSINREKKAFGKKDEYVAKGAGSGTRSINFQPRPAFDAKGRNDLPDQIIINKGQGYAALAPYLPGHRNTNAATAAA
jgi:hypothetical protein